MLPAQDGTKNATSTKEVIKPATISQTPKTRKWMSVTNPGALSLSETVTQNNLCCIMERQDDIFGLLVAATLPSSIVSAIFSPCHHKLTSPTEGEGNRRRYVHQYNLKQMQQPTKEARSELVQNNS